MGQVLSNFVARKSPPKAENPVWNPDDCTIAITMVPQVVVSAPMKEQCYKLAELGWLHRRIRKFVEAMDRSRGLVMQVGVAWGEVFWCVFSSMLNEVVTLGQSSLYIVSPYYGLPAKITFYTVYADPFTLVLIGGCRSTLGCKPVAFWSPTKIHCGFDCSFHGSIRRLGIKRFSTSFNKNFLEALFASCFH